jgi:hypothetical protein
MLLLYCLRRILGHLRHHCFLFAFALHHVVILCLRYFLLWCTDYVLHLSVTLGVHMFLHVLLHSHLRDDILLCSLHFLCDILLVVVLRKNVAFDQRFAVMRKYITFRFSFLVRCCSMRYLLLLSFDAITMSIMVSRFFSPTTVIRNMVSVTEDIM